MEEKKSNAKKMALIMVLFTIIVCVVVCFVISSLTKKDDEKESVSGNDNNIIVNNNNGNTIANRNDSIPSTEINIVPTLLDEVSNDTVWCATFQLVWNDMQNEVIKQPIVFDPQLEIVENLNEQSFTEDDISDEYYYKIYGLKTLKLKEEIENGIKEKFNQTSDILDMVNWSDAPEDDDGYSNDLKNYIFYAMLYREFNFDKVFTVLDNDEFKGSEKTYSDIEYFGIDETTDSMVYNQVDVLYYNSEDDFAVILNTKEGDQVLLTKGENGDTFKEIYDNVRKQELKYKGLDHFTSLDTLKVPKIQFDLLKEFTELEDKMFKDKDKNEYMIGQAFQTIKFELNEKGGKIKSEAAIVSKEMAARPVSEPEERNFNCDGTFTMFLIDGENDDKPYFAVTIDNISLYQ